MRNFVAASYYFNFFFYAKKESIFAAQKSLK